jgi:hypothetical protein
MKASTQREDRSACSRGRWRRLLGAAEKDRLHHSFNLRGHFLSRDAVGSLEPAARGSGDGPGRRGREQCCIDAGCQLMMGSALQEHALDDRDNGAFEGHFRQLGRTARSLSEIVTDAACNGAECAIAVCEGKATARDEITEAGGCHGL